MHVSSTALLSSSYPYGGARSKRAPASTLTPRCSFWRRSTSTSRSCLWQNITLLPHLQDTAGWTSGSSAISGHCRVDQWIQCYNRTLQGGPVDPVLYQDTTSGSSAISGHCRVDQWIQCYNRTLQGGPVDPVLSTGSTGPPCSVL